MIRFTTGFAATTRIALLGSAAAFCLAGPAAALAQDAGEAQPATDAPAEEDYSGNEIIVTATKREQTLQDVPIAVSVTTNESIERAQIRDLKDLSTLVPSLRVAERQTSANTNFFIRGFGNGANNAGIEPSVGVFVDGVYRSRSAGQITDLPDVQRVEVLRGPQSTLFGKNASAGVISIVTQKPKFKFGGNVEASYGNYDAIVVKGVVTGPISETVAASLAAGYNKRKGYNENLATGVRVNDRNRWFIRGQLLFEGDSSLKARLIADYGKIDEVCCGVFSVLTGPRTGILTNPLIGGGQVNAANAAFDDKLYFNTNPTNKIDNWGLSGQLDYEFGPATLTSITAYRETKLRSRFDIDFTSADLLNGANVGRMDLKTFTQELRLSANFVDRVNVLLGAFYFNEKVDQGGDLTWGSRARPYADALVRAFSNNALSIAALETTFGALQGNPALYTGPNQFFAQGQGLVEAETMKNENFSIFSQVDFKIADRLTLTGGVNYTNDKKRYTIGLTSNTDAFAALNFNAPQFAPFRNTLLFQGAVAQGAGTALGLGRSATQAEIVALASGTSPLGAAGAAAYAGQIVPGATLFANANQNNPLANPLAGLRQLQFLPPILGIPNAVENGRTSDDKFTFTARLAYDITDQLNGYVSYATGYKASSIDLSRFSRPFLADSAALTAAGIALPNQEFGTRYADPENSAVIEGGLKGQWSGVSANLAVFHQTIKGFQSNIFVGDRFVLRNAGKQSVWGVEFESQFKPVKPLTLGLSMTFLNPKYDDFSNSAFGLLTGTRPSDIPGFSGTVSADYTHDLANDDSILFHVDFHHESKVQVIEGLPAFAVGSNFQPALDAAKPFTREVNEMNASLSYAMSNGLELTVWGRNLTNDRYINTIFDSPAQAGSVSAYTNQPRTWGGSVRFRF